MPSLANFFSQEPFDMLSVTTSLSKMPFQERRLGALSLFVPESIDTTIVEIDEHEGQLQVLSTRPRGAPPEVAAADKKRKARLLKVPHMSFIRRIEAAEVQNDRVTGDVIMSSALTKVNDRLEWMRQQVENTFEVHRLNALKGVLLDADASVIFDYFAEFEVTQQTQNFVFSVATTDIRGTCIDATHQVEDALGAVPYTELRAIAGRNFFKKLVSHPNVKEAYANWQAAVALTQDLRAGFLFGGIMWEEYRGMRNLPNDIGIVDDDEAYLFPVGATGMFRVAHAPGDFIGSVNTLGTPWTAKVAPDLAFDKYIDVLVETDPLFHNTRPDAVIKCTLS